MKTALAMSHVSIMTGVQVVWQISLWVVWQMTTMVFANPFIQYKGTGVPSLLEPFQAVSAFTSLQFYLAC